MPLTINDLQIRSKNVHCSSDLSNETCETFFQIWSHKAANISNDLIEYTIRHRQLDRLRFLLQTRNELSQRQNASPICQILTHIEDDLRRINEHIRRFCLSTRNLYRHLRSDSRIYPKMSIALDEGIIIKICRFMFKTKVLIKIISKEQSLNVEQDEQSNQKRIKTNDPYKNITKAFVALQSNFEILFGDVVEKDFFQNAKAAVQTLPIILDTSKTIRLIFCALYKLTEPERQAEVEAIRQRRLASTSNKKELFPSSSSSAKTSVHSSKHSLQEQKQVLLFLYFIETKYVFYYIDNQNKSPHQKMKIPKRTNNKNASATHSASSNIYNESMNTDNNIRIKIRSSNQTPIMNEKNVSWTTWLHNAKLSLTSILQSSQTNKNVSLSKPLLTTWASLDRISKL
ncbi:unnamed protein product [Rotaria magnacalcarata]|uniref:Uncharacterized protein n=1 Tax=Rotaria magnacalcarata TaxID=392030 RepID=A0A816AT03_9BILA|nr:unnamed protein product [Rotaria magnacalcarata]